jgi:hypothetical protein
LRIGDEVSSQELRRLDAPSHKDMAGHFTHGRPVAQTDAVT